MTAALDRCKPKDCQMDGIAAGAGLLRGQWLDRRNAIALSHKIASSNTD